MSALGWHCVAPFLAVQMLDWEEWLDRCPLCNGTSVTIGAESTTLLGGGDGTHRGDPNHRHGIGSCKDCSGHFIRETRGGEVWFTAQKENPGRYETHGSGRVLAGIPACFEHYEAPCRCGGVVRNKWYNADGTTPNTNGWIQYGVHREFYECDRCTVRVENAALSSVPPPAPGETT